VNVRRTATAALAVVGLAIAVALPVAPAPPPAAASTRPPDPATSGPFAVTREGYDLGDTAYRPPGFPAPVELRARVSRPTDLAGGPFPLVVFLHGRHGTCYDPASGFELLEWPCTGGSKTIPSFRGYDYIAKVLASNGYIVVSISANGINARDNEVFDLGALARAQLIQRHLDLWRGFNTTGGAPFGTTFVGKVDLARVGTMGHSRGGEGVVRHVLYNREQGSRYGIRAVLPLAPVDFNRDVTHGVALNVMLPYCDGDVSDLQGVHFYDDGRYADPNDTAPRHLVYVLGANHNFFNAKWTPSQYGPGAFDDWFYGGDPSDPACGTAPGTARLSDAQQRAVGLAYTVAFFRAYLGGDAAQSQFLTGEAPPPPSVGLSRVYVSYHAPSGRRLDLNRLLEATALDTDALGGKVLQTGLSPFDLCGGEAPQRRHCLHQQPFERQPHTTRSYNAFELRGLSQLRFGWAAAGAVLEQRLPAGSGNVSGYQVLEFRAAVNFEDSRNPRGQSQDVTVELEDRAGGTTSVRAGSYSGALFYPPGDDWPLPKVVLNTVRIPLEAFTGVDLTQLHAVRLRFDRRASGAVLLSDFTFAKPPG
jgi:hypothetical protein